MGQEEIGASQPLRSYREEQIAMLPVPRRVVESYHIRYQLGSLLGDRDRTRIPGAIDLLVHAQPGTEDALDIAKAASRAHMGAVVFKNLPRDVPLRETRQRVADESRRWAEQENLAPVECFHGV